MKDFATIPGHITFCDMVEKFIQERRTTIFCDIPQNMSVSAQRLVRRIGKD